MQRSRGSVKEGSNFAYVETTDRFRFLLKTETAVLVTVIIIRDLLTVRKLTNTSQYISSLIVFLLSNTTRSSEQNKLFPILFSTQQTKRCDL